MAETKAISEAIKVLDKAKRERRGSKMAEAKVKVKRVSKAKMALWQREAEETKAERQKRQRQVKVLSLLTSEEREAIKKRGERIERQKTKRGLTKAERQTLDNAFILSQGSLGTNLSVKGFKITLRSVAKRFVSNPIEAIEREEIKAKVKYLPLDYLPLSEETGLSEEDTTCLYLREAEETKPKVVKIPQSEFRRLTEERLEELQSLPEEIQVYLASAYVMSCKGNRRVWSDREDIFQTVITSILEVSNKGELKDSLSSEDRLIDIGFKPSLSESQAYCIAKRRLTDYWRQVYKQSRESSLERSLIGEDILALPLEEFNQVINKRGNTPNLKRIGTSRGTEESLVSEAKLQTLGFESNLNKSEDWNRHREAELILLKAKREAEIDRDKLRSERREARVVLRDTLEYSRLSEAEADLVVTLKSIKDKRFRKIFIEVKEAETSKLSEVLTEADYTYLKRYLKKYPLIESKLRGDLVTIKRAKLGEAEITV